MRAPSALPKCRAPWNLVEFLTRPIASKLARRATMRTTFRTSIHAPEVELLALRLPLMASSRAAAIGLYCLCAAAATASRQPLPTSPTSARRDSTFTEQPLSSWRLAPTGTGPRRSTMVAVCTVAVTALYREALAPLGAPLSRALPPPRATERWASGTFG